MSGNKPSGIMVIVAFMVALVILLLLIILFISDVKDFRQELRIINCEIERCEGEEQKEWKRRKRRLWLSLIPFVKYQ